MNLRTTLAVGALAVGLLLAAGTPAARAHRQATTAQGGAMTNQGNDA